MKRGLGRITRSARTLGGVLLQIPPAAPMIAVAVIASLASSGATPATRAVVLAATGGGIVAVTEILTGWTIRHTWRGQPVEARFRLERRAQFGLSAAFGVAVAAVAWAIVIAAGTVTTAASVVLAAGGLGAIVAPTLFVLAWQRSGRDRQSGRESGR